MREYRAVAENLMFATTEVSQQALEMRQKALLAPQEESRLATVLMI